MCLAAGDTPGVKGRKVKNEHFRVRGPTQTDPRDHFRCSICAAPLKMPL
jgi:hypothetical protein